MKVKKVMKVISLSACVVTAAELGGGCCTGWLMTRRPSCFLECWHSSS